jgi:hypothetical protein
MDVKLNTLPSILDLSTKISLKETTTRDPITNACISSVKR